MENNNKGKDKRVIRRSKEMKMKRVGGGREPSIMNLQKANYLQQRWKGDVE